MINEKIEIWKKEEYHYPAAHGFIPVMFSYIHEDEKKHPAMIIAPGGAYREVSPSEAHLPAMEFYGAGYNVFVLEYTINQLDEAPLKMQPLHDISRAIRMIRSRAEEFHIRPDRIAACGFSAGAHLCGSLCVHNKDVEDPEEAYQNISNRPDVAILSYPVITSGKYAHRDSFVALFGKEPSEQELDYMSLENHVTKDTPPCFLWQTVTDQTVPVENSYLFAQACAQAGVPFAQHVFSEGIHGLSVATEEWLKKLFANGQVATQYVDDKGNPTMDEFWNPNGSYMAIEGITSPDGRILGKMAHSERRGDAVAMNIYGEQDMKIFESGVKYFL